MVKFILTLSFFVGFVFGLSAQTTLPNNIRENVQARIDNGTNTGVVIAIIDASGTKYYSFGVKSLKTKEPVDEFSIFEIGSVTKTFTGILLADMVLKNEVKLDDPLQKYLPAGITAPTRNGESIKLVQLANHTSALPRMPDNFNPADPNNPFADYTEKQMYDFLVNYKLPRNIGSQYEYSNYGAGLLGNILASKKKKTYEQLMIDVIAKPLSLNNTRITLTPDMQAHLAKGHANGSEVQNWDLPTLAGAGAVRSDAVDMAKYVSANMGKDKSKLYSAMQLAQKNTRAENSDQKVGLGWHLMGTGASEIIWHNGGTGGYRSFVGFTKDGAKGVVVLTNSNESVDDIGVHILNPASPLKPVSNKEVVKEVTVDVATLDTYVGKYQLAPSFVLTITRKDSQLSVQATGQPVFPIFAKSQTEFFLKVVEAQLTFNKDQSGKVISVTLFQAGQESTGDKIE